CDASFAAWRQAWAMIPMRQIYPPGVSPQSPRTLVPRDAFSRELGPRIVRCRSTSKAKLRAQDACPACPAETGYAVDRAMTCPMHLDASPRCALDAGPTGMRQNICQIYAK